MVALALIAEIGAVQVGRTESLVLFDTAAAGGSFERLEFSDLDPFAQRFIDERQGPSATDSADCREGQSWIGIDSIDEGSFTDRVPERVVRFKLSPCLGPRADESEWLLIMQGDRVVFHEEFGSIDRVVDLDEDGLNELVVRSGFYGNGVGDWSYELTAARGQVSRVLAEFGTTIDWCGYYGRFGTYQELRVEYAPTQPGRLPTFSSYLDEFGCEDIPIEVLRTLPTQRDALRADPMVMHAVARTGDPILLEYLYFAARDDELRAWVNHADGDGITPLMVAAAHNTPAMVRALLESSADVHARATSGWTALHHAARDARDATLIDLLVGAGASLAARTERDQTPLDVAIGAANAGSVEALREARAQQERGDRWFRVLDVPLPSGPVNGVTIHRRPVNPDGSVASWDTLHVWVFADRRRPLLDEQFLVLDGTTEAVRRYWALDAQGQPTAITEFVGTESTVSTVMASPDRLEVVKRLAGFTTTSAYSFQPPTRTITGSATLMGPAGSFTSRQTIEYGADGASTTASAMVSGAETGRSERDDANFLRRTRNALPTGSQRFDVIERDAYGNPVQVTVSDLFTGRTTARIDILYAYGPKPERTTAAVRVVTDSLRVGATPSIRGTRITAKFGGAAGVLLSDTPTWADGYWWWNVRFDDGTVGWVANGDDAGPWLGNADGRALRAPFRPGGAR